MQVQAAESAKLAAEQALQREQVKLRDTQDLATKLQDQLNQINKGQQVIKTKTDQDVQDLSKKNSELATLLAQSKLAFSQQEEKVRLVNQQLAATTEEYKGSQKALQAANEQIAKLSKDTLSVKAALSKEQDAVIKARSALVQAEKDKDAVEEEKTKLLAEIEALRGLQPVSKPASTGSSGPSGSCLKLLSPSCCHMHMLCL